VGTVSGKRRSRHGRGKKEREQDLTHDTHLELELGSRPIRVSLSRC
jgi:hypothetical protein